MSLPSPSSLFPFSLVCRALSTLHSSLPHVQTSSSSPARTTTRSTTSVSAAPHICLRPSLLQRQNSTNSDQQYLTQHQRPQRRCPRLCSTEMLVAVKMEYWAILLAHPRYVVVPWTNTVESDVLRGVIASSLSSFCCRRRMPANQTM
jgi:hypothetical protein